MVICGSYMFENNVSKDIENRIKIRMIKGELQHISEHIF